MKYIKRMLLLLFAVTLLLALSGTVCAEETNTLTAENDGSVSISATTELRNTPSFTVNIPQSIPLGSLQRAATEGTYADTTFRVSVTDRVSLGDKEIRVRLSTADGSFKLYNGIYELPYEVKIGDTALVSGDTFATFTADNHDAVDGRIVVDRYDIAAEGTYMGVLLFTVSVE